jgi:penicillin V acylase-like amidase (Ntn superfamily)
MVSKRAMIDIPINDGYVYESPDGGATIYRRLIGTNKREQYYVSPDVKAKMRWVNLRDAVKLAENEPSLNDALSKVEMLYQLLKDNEGT